MLQLRSMLLTYKMLVLSTGVLWFFKENTCLSFVTTWLGIVHIFALHEVHAIARPDMLA